MSAIFKRVSVRKFLSTPVTEDEVTSLLHAGMSAPSAWNARPWHFIAVNNRNVLDAIPKIHPYAGMLASAPLAIIVCGDISLELNDAIFFQQNCSAATENILIRAVELKLGGVWVGIYPNEERVIAVKKLLNIPENIIPFALIPLGHPNEINQKTKDRYIPSRVHINQW